MRDVNIFDNPDFYIKELENITIDDGIRINGKSMITVWLTQICNANCAHCFSKPSHISDITEMWKHKFTTEGINKLISFINDSRCGYLMISGGGEPFSCFDQIIEIVSRVMCDKIVINTNGSWGEEYEEAVQTLKKLYETIRSKENVAEVVVRVSVDAYHNLSLGSKMICNIINVFKQYYSMNHNFKLMFHTMIDDKTLDNIVSSLGGYIEISPEVNVYSDSTIFNKIIPQKGKVFIDDYVIPVGYAKLFYPNFGVNLKQNNNEKQLIEIFDQDITYSEFGNPSLTFNEDGTRGFDFWIHYNGNVTTWGNQIPGNVYNIYLDDYNYIAYNTMHNLYSYSFIDKGYYYRERIISEVNPKAVLRSKMAHLRNYTSYMQLEERHTRLYLGIRILQDYLSDSQVKSIIFNGCSPELIDRIYNRSKQELISEYNHSQYNICIQNRDELHDLWEYEVFLWLIKMGHYCISEEAISETINFVNEKYSKQYSSIEDIKRPKYNLVQKYFSQETDRLRMYHKLYSKNQMD